ncbi:hypothetical protein BUALT_Bualt03G0208300 [Buddleja alternifolia]|uniref:F-box domain-containing protein n=1 Tax=Buddleja alternifolia TaxID=168488 RepID=A0AAV6XVF4_9LAMI|nr:hypothetical protein BUALT_Bualt03G0208300 [Buddleja alternifolia]
MKLRLRSSESKETLKIEAPNSCNLLQLKEILSQTIPNSPLTTSIRLSLNRKDEIQSDGEDSLHSIGIASGDLIYFSVDHPTTGMTSKPISLRSECSTSLNTENPLPEGQNSDSMIADSEKGKTVDRGLEMEENIDEMEVVDEDNENSYSSDVLLSDVVEKSFSVPGFIRKVFVEELGNDSGRDHKLIVIAVHAVMLESGFVGFDKNANVVVNGFQFRNEWPSRLFSVSLFYTLPEILTGANAIKSTVVLKFQSLGKFINVYGTLGNGSGKKGTYRVQLNEDELVAFLNVVWANCGVTENISGQNGDFSVEKEVFKFWRNVKDNLALPLLIDLCEESGLELPPCFTRLPTDLKLKILESLPGVDVAKVSCVSSELRYLGSSDDLWKMKFDEEFTIEEKEAQLSWKKAFALVCERRKSRKVTRGIGSHWPPAPFWPQHRRRRNPNAFNFARGPRIIGGDYDIGPAFGDDLQTGLPNSANHRMRVFSRHVI